VKERSLALNLAHAIEVYFTSENAHDAAAVADCFQPDAIVQSESGLKRGVEAIKSWRLENARKFQHRVDPLYALERDGATIVACRLSGNFPSGAVTANFVFKLEGGKIASLVIE
jgi:hypothetical protein